MKGRTFRRRKKVKITKSEVTDREIPWQSNLLKHSLSQGMKIKGIAPKQFESTGRGMAASRCIEQNSLLISVPKILLLTLDSIFYSDIGHVLQHSPYKFTGKELFALFLLQEVSKREQSIYYYYILSLPKTYTTLDYLHREELVCLPKDLRSRASECFRELECLMAKSKMLEKCCCSRQCNTDMHFLKEIHLDNLKWAVNAVNSRSVYFNSQLLNHQCSRNVEDADFVMVPVLDMFNHTANAKVSIFLIGDMKIVDSSKPCFLISIPLQFILLLLYFLNTEFIHFQICTDK